MLQCLHSLFFLVSDGHLALLMLKVLVARLEARYRFAGDSTGNISSSATPRNGRVVRVEAGHRLFSPPPARLRWEYESPEKKSVSSWTASRLGFYVPADPHRHRVFPAKESTGLEDSSGTACRRDEGVARVRPDNGLLSMRRRNPRTHVVLFCELRGAGLRGAGKKRFAGSPSADGRCRRGSLLRDRQGFGRSSSGCWSEARAARRESNFHFTHWPGRTPMWDDSLFRFHASPGRGHRGNGELPAGSRGLNP